MVTKIQKWGNSQGLRFPREIMVQARIAIGDQVVISVKKGEIVIKPAVQERKKHDLNALVAKLPRGKSKEVIWGKPRGKEAW